MGLPLRYTHDKKTSLGYRFSAGSDNGSQPLGKQSPGAGCEPSHSQQQAAAAASEPQGLWGENRLADVVKGTARPKGGAGKDQGEGSPRAASPQPSKAAASRQNSAPEAKEAAAENGEIQLSSVTLTPPSSPEK